MSVVVFVHAMGNTLLKKGGLDPLKLLLGFSSFRYLLFGLQLCYFGSGPKDGEDHQQPAEPLLKLRWFGNFLLQI